MKRSALNNFVLFKPQTKKSSKYAALFCGEYLKFDAYLRELCGEFPGCQK